MSGQKLGHKVKSQEKTCVHYRGQIFGPIIMKLGLTVCVNEILDELENGSYWVKN